MMKAVKRIKLSRMPYDKFVDGRFIHATGYEVKLEDGSWVLEYEDQEYEDAPDCKYSEEEEEEEEEKLEYHCIYENDEMTVEA
jgi:hypothetical protein